MVIIDDTSAAVEPYNKERYHIIISEDWYIFVLQVHKDFLPCHHLFGVCLYFTHGLGGANPAVNTPRLSRGTRIKSCDFIVLIGDP